MATKSSKPKVKVSSKAEKKEEFSLISNATLRALYADLRKCERVAKRGGPGAAYDAMISGVLMDLGDGDAVASTNDDAAVRLKRAGKPVAAVGLGLDAAVGTALLAKVRKSRKVGVIFGEPSTEAFQDALETARHYALPLIFVSRTHGADEIAERRAVRRPAKKSKSAKHALAEGHLPRMYVDANDVVAVYRVAQEAIARARRGQGPTLIECKTYRWYGHSEIDPAKYRDPEEVERWKAKDPIAGMEKYLTGKGLFTAAWKQEIVDGFNNELDAAIEIAEKSALPEGVEALDHVYSFDIRERVLNPKSYSPSY